MLGVRVVRVAGFSESVPSENGPMPYYMGGMSEMQLDAPAISAGSERIEVVVNVDFELE